MTVGVPVVMVLSGNDPSGGAGVQADIEAIASMGCHTVPIVTALTVQDTVAIKEVVPIAPGLIAAQARAVLEDMPVAAIKIGALPDVATIEIIHTLLGDYPALPVICDPLGALPTVETAELYQALQTLLLPQVTVLTVTSREARRLAPEADTLEACAMALLARDCRYVLITGTHEPTVDVLNVLYGGQRRLDSYRWERLAQQYKGAGCTLSAALAGLFAQGQELHTAIYQAQEYTWDALRAGYRIGLGWPVPNRLFWADDHETR